jgi:hypothetical protein
MITLRRNNRRNSTKGTQKSYGTEKQGEEILG